MKKIGFVGHGEDKFDVIATGEVYHLMLDIMRGYKEPIIIVSGHSPVGGVDIWAERLAAHLGLSTDIKAPKRFSWDGKDGFKDRNIRIAIDSDELHVILAENYPADYKGMKFSNCYHCNTTGHIKSGACWTRKYAERLGKKTFVHLIHNHSGRE